MTWGRGTGQPLSPQSYLLSYVLCQPGVKHRILSRKTASSELENPVILLPVRTVVDQDKNAKTRAFISHIGLKGPHRKLDKEEGTLHVSGVPLACEPAGQIPASHLPCASGKIDKDPYPLRR